MFREKLTEFYKCYNPACLDSIDDILDIFEGREEELFRVLQEKYADARCVSRESSASVTSITAQGGGDKEKLHDPKCEPLMHSGFNRRNLTGFHRFCAGEADSYDLAKHTWREESALLPSSYPRMLVEANEVNSLRSDNAALKAENRSLRCDLLVLQAENRALSKQKSDDEETLGNLREHIAHHDRLERELVEDVSVAALKGKSLLNEDEFVAIISASQQRLRDYYEERIAFMQTELDTFYRHAAARIHEKDDIIAALKQQHLSQS